MTTVCICRLKLCKCTDSLLNYLYNTYFIIKRYSTQPLFITQNSQVNVATAGNVSSNSQYIN